MDIGDNRMEKIDLTNLKSLASEICKTYFFEQQDCEKRAEEAILEASNYDSDDPIKYFSTIATLTLRFYGKNKNLIGTFELNDNASIFSLDIISRFSEFPYEHFLTPISYDMCYQLNKDPRRCIDSLGFLSFWHDIHMHTLSYRHRGIPMDDEFTYLLYFLLRNIMMQYIASGDIKVVENAEKVINAYIKKITEELKEMIGGNKK